MGLPAPAQPTVALHTPACQSLSFSLSCVCTLVPRHQEWRDPVRPGVVRPGSWWGCWEQEEEGGRICPGSGADLQPLSQEWRERGRRTLLHWLRIKGNKVQENWPCSAPLPGLIPFPQPEAASALVQTGQDLSFRGWMLRSGQGRHLLSVPRLFLYLTEFMGVVGRGCLVDCGAVSLAIAPSLSLFLSPQSTRPKFAPDQAWTEEGLPEWLPLGSH